MEEPVEHADVTYAKHTIDKMPAVINYGMFMYQ